jgi:hypothetical protein
MSVDASHWKDVVDMYCPEMSLGDVTVRELVGWHVTW